MGNEPCPSRLQPMILLTELGLPKVLVILLWYMSHVGVQNIIFSIVSHLYCFHHPACLCVYVMSVFVLPVTVTLTIYVFNKLQQQAKRHLSVVSVNEES